MKYEFASPAWLAAIHGIISERAAWLIKDTPDLRMSICEVFTGAPAHLADQAGKIVWSCVIDGAGVDFRLAERDDVRFKVTVAYAAVLPLGRFDTKGDPERRVELSRMSADLIERGVMKIVGARDADPRAMPSVHDAIARLTA
jgi:hypothetical protein